MTANLNSALVAELLTAPRPEARHSTAELAAILRCSDAICIRYGRPVIEATLDDPGTGRHVARLLHENFGAAVHLSAPVPGTYVVRVFDPQHCEKVIQHLGLISPQRRFVIGMPPSLVAASARDAGIAAAALRGAVLVSSRTTVTPRRGSVLRVHAPGPAAAMAIAGFARKVGAKPELREMVRGPLLGDCAVIRDHAGLHALLVELGAPQFATEHIAADAVPMRTNCAESLITANQARAAAAGKDYSERITLALKVLGPHLRADLAEVAQLRLDHPDVSMAELGQLCVPPVGKNTIAGRLRRLMQAVNSHERAENVPA